MESKFQKVKIIRWADVDEFFQLFVIFVFFEYFLIPIGNLNLEKSTKKQIVITSKMLYNILQKIFQSIFEDGWKFHSW